MPPFACDPYDRTVIPPAFVHVLARWQAELLTDEPPRRGDRPPQRPRPPRAPLLSLAVEIRLPLGRRLRFAAGRLAGFSW